MLRELMPRILIIDDFFGRLQADRRNTDRSNLCGTFRLEDITRDEVGKGPPRKIGDPIAQAYFYRGQKPLRSTVGDIVENDLASTIKVIEEGWIKPPYWSLVLLDLCFYTGKVTKESDRQSTGMPEGRPGDDNPKQYFGLKILSAIKENFPNLPVVVLSSKPEQEVGLDYTRLGAFGFIPRSDENSPSLLKEHLYRNALMPDETGEIVGCSKALMIALRNIRRASAQGGRRNILFRGETGTGKGLFASYAHLQMTKGNNQTPFEVVNCPQISSERFASELFGHKKGAFTDAKEDKPGIIEKANGGDVFLDEIAELPHGVQAGILKVIEERVFTRIGETVMRSANLRFLSATNSNLTGLREDLLMRLTEGGTISLPPLRDRKDDIPILVEKFVREAEKTSNARSRTIESETIVKLQDYNWPGNVRELRNCIYQAVEHFSELPYLIPEHIAFNIQYAAPFVATSEDSDGMMESITISNKRFIGYALPGMIREHHEKVVKYIINAFEHCRDKRNDTLNYPQIWHALTGEDIKDSTTCQRKIGNYIFKLSVEEIASFMQESPLFEKAVFQCGNKIKSAAKRLPDIEKGFRASRMA